LQVEGISNIPGWAVGCYFVPIANLFRPYIEMQEIWCASDPEQLDRPRSWQKCPPTNLIRFWWISFLAASFLSGLGFMGADPDLDIADLSPIWAMYGLSNLCMVAAGTLLIFVIRGVTQRQRERYARLYEEN
jgi:Domain of unknown function (DUF4328)